MCVGGGGARARARVCVRVCVCARADLSEEVCLYPGADWLKPVSHTEGLREAKLVYDYHITVRTCNRWEQV